jgi:hypothetical protein
VSAPNLLSSTTVTGKTVLSLLTTVTANVLTNSSGSNTVAKVENIILTNYSGSSAVANVVVNRSSTTYYVAGAIAIPANSTLTVIGKDAAFYLEEGDVLQSNVSANTAVSMTAAYELIAS